MLTTRRHQRVWSEYCATVVAAGIAAQPYLNNGELAKKFGVNRETLRRIRRDLHAGLIKVDLT